jgi:hypothetical protein
VYEEPLPLRAYFEAAHKVSSYQEPSTNAHRNGWFDEEGHYIYSWLASPLTEEQASVIVK